MFFNSIKEIYRSRKEINRLLSKGMLIIYLRVSIEKIDALKIRFSKFKNLSPGQFLDPRKNGKPGPETLVRP